MRLILFAHPRFLPSQSMMRFARMLERGYQARGYQVEVWAPEPAFRNWIATGPLSKWAGYVDQFALFPIQVRRLLRNVPSDSLFVFVDQALGPWVPLVEAFPHVVHCHDLLALRSALGDVSEHTTSWTGRLYQRFIRAGFRRARHFISVSEKSRSDLHTYGGVSPLTSEVVYNGLNDVFSPLPPDRAGDALRSAGWNPEPNGMILSVGANVWYKNRAGLLKIYEHYAKAHPDPLPLWIVGTEPTPDESQHLGERVAPGKVQFLPRLDNLGLRAAYSRAKALLFPSLAEGFGWPIAEAMACGCPVLTTGEAPMTEVGGDAARYIPRLKLDSDIDAWAARCSHELSALLALGSEERDALIEAGFAQAARFSADRAIDGYLSVYRKVFELERGGQYIAARPGCAGSPVESAR